LALRDDVSRTDRETSTSRASGVPEPGGIHVQGTGAVTVLVVPAPGQS
jgi:hypothetical protein